MKSCFASIVILIVSSSAYAQSDSEISHPELRSELREMARVDQIARTRSPIDPDEMIEVDRKNTARLMEIVKEHGWPTISMVSESGAQSAWLLAQHADQTPSFQEEVLSLMEPLLERGEVLRRNYAYLYDRTHSPQLYGTQGLCTGPGVWEPRDMDDPDNVDERRAEMGISPLKLEDYILNVSKLCE